MPNWNQLKSYIQNPSVAIKELAAQKRGFDADTDQYLKDKSIEDAKQTAQMVPGSNPDPMNMYNTMNAAQGMASVGGVGDIMKNPEALAAFQKLGNQAKTGTFEHATDAAMWQKLTGKPLPVNNEKAKAEALKRLRGY